MRIKFYRNNKNKNKGNGNFISCAMVNKVHNIYCFQRKKLRNVR